MKNDEQTAQEIAQQHDQIERVYRVLSARREAEAKDAALEEDEWALEQSRQKQERLCYRKPRADCC